MRLEMKITGNCTLADLQQAIRELRRAGCPWEAPVTSLGGIDVVWVADPQRTEVRE